MKLFAGGSTATKDISTTWEKLSFELPMAKLGALNGILINHQVPQTSIRFENKSETMSPWSTKDVQPSFCFPVFFSQSSGGFSTKTRIHSPCWFLEGNHWKYAVDFPAQYIPSLPSFRSESSKLKEKKRDAPLVPWLGIKSLLFTRRFPEPQASGASLVWLWLEGRREETSPLIRVWIWISPFYHFFFRGTLLLK